MDHNQAPQRYHCCASTKILCRNHQRGRKKIEPKRLRLNLIYQTIQKSVHRDSIPVDTVLPPVARLLYRYIVHVI